MKKLYLDTKSQSMCMRVYARVCSEYICIYVGMSVCIVSIFQMAMVYALHKTRN